MVCHVFNIVYHVFMSRPQPTQERSRQRVESIVDAAYRLLRTGGKDACTVAAIATEAGITPASLYRYFADATEILRALAERTLDDLHAELISSLARVTREEDIEPVLTETLDNYATAFEQDRALRELWFGTLADPELIALNIADSRRNGNAIADAVAPFCEIPRPMLRTRGFLLAHTVGSSVGLMLDVPARERAAIRRELRRMLLATLMGPPKDVW
jgi:AcrR family transcriptional regulator